MSAIGSIYVEVKGDITTFQKDMTALRSLAKKSGKDVSDALNNAIMPDKARSSMAGLTTGLTQLAQSAKAPAANFKATAAAISKDFEHVAQKIGMTSKEFTALNEKMLRNQAFNQANSAMKQVASSAGLTSKEVKALGIQMGYSSKEAEKMAASFNKAGAGGQSFLGSVMSLRANILTAGIAIAGVVYSIKSMGDAIFETGQKTLVAENAYRAITGSVKNADREFGFLKKTSEDLGLNFYTLRDGYKGFLAAAQSSKIPMEEVREIFKSISNAGAVMGLSNERMSLTFLALEQMMSKGKVSMEELRRQLGDNLPGAFQIGAKAMGMTVEAFDQAVSAGEVYSEEFLPKFRVAMDEAFQGTVADSVKQVNKLGEAWEDIKNKMSEGQFMDSISKSMKSITEMLKDPAFIQGMADAAAMLGKFIELSAKYAAYQGKSFGAAMVENDAARMQASGLIQENIWSMSDEQRRAIVNFYKEVESLSASATEKINKNSETATDDIQKYMGVSASEIKAIIQTTAADIKTLEGSASFSSLADLKSQRIAISEYSDKLIELERAYSAAASSGDRLVNTTENQNAAMIAAPFDKEIASLEAWERSQQQKKEIMAGVEKDIQKILDESDSNKLAKLNEALYLFKESQEKRPDIVEGIKKQIADIEQKMAEPGIAAAKKAAEEQRKIDEDHVKRLSAISDEYKKLSLSAEEYGKYEIDKWFEEESKAIGGTTKELQALYDLKVKNLNFENRYSNIDMATPELGLTDEEKIAAHLKGVEDKKKADQEYTDAVEKQAKKQADDYEKALRKQEDAFIDFSKTVQDYTADILYDWENMGEAMVKIIKRTVVEMAASLLSQQLIVPIALQAGSAMGLSWNGTPMASMAGPGSNVLGMASNASSLYNSFSGGTSNFLNSGLGGKVGSSIFGNSAWFGTPYYGASEFMVPASYGAVGSTAGGIAGSLGTAVPYGIAGSLGYSVLGGALGLPQSKYSGASSGLGAGIGGLVGGPIRAVAGTLLGGIVGGLFGDDEPEPQIVFSFGEGFGGPGVSDMGFSAYTQDMPGGIEVLARDYFETQLKAIDNSLSISFADVVKKRAQNADAGLDLVGVGWDPETYGGVEGTLKVASVWIAKNLAQGVAEAYGLNGLTNGVGGTATSFFESILPSGSENLLDAFVRFGTVMDGTEDAANALARQMELLAGDTTQAFLNLENILTVFQSIDALIDPLTQINNPLVQTIDLFETYIDELKEANATLEDVTRAEDKRTQALGLQLTGLSAGNVGQSLISAITGGESVGDGLNKIIGQAIGNSLATALTNDVMEEAILPFVDQIGKAFTESGNDVEAVFAMLPGLLADLDTQDLQTKLEGINKNWREMFDVAGLAAEAETKAKEEADKLAKQLEDLAEAEREAADAAREAMEAAIDARDSAASEYLSALQKELSVLESNMNSAKAIYVGLLQDEASAHEALAKSLEDAIDSIRKYRESLYSGSDSPLGLAGRQEALLLKRTILSGQVMAGDVDSVGELLSVSQDYLAVAKDMSSTELEYAREVALTNALLSEVEGKAGVQLSAAKQQAIYFQDLIKLVDESSYKISRIDEARTAYEDAKTAFDTSWMTDEIAVLEALLDSSKSLETLMAEFNAANAAAESAIASGGVITSGATTTTGTSGTGTWTMPDGTQMNDEYAAILAQDTINASAMASEYNNPGKNYADLVDIFGSMENVPGTSWAGATQGALTQAQWAAVESASDPVKAYYDQLKTAIGGYSVAPNASAGAYDRAAGTYDYAGRKLGQQLLFAEGGIISGSDSGYQMPGATFHGPEAIIPLDRLDHSALVDKIEKLVVEVQRLREENKAHSISLIKSAQKIERNTDYIEQWDVDGIPAERTA